MTHKTEIEAIILDLGGVILNLDYHATTKAFFDLGFTEFDVLYSQAGQIGLFDKFETGEISEDIFFEELNRLGNKSLSKNLLIEAWNKMLLDFNSKAIDIVTELRQNYSVYLFSNTNETHYQKFNKFYHNYSKGLDFDALFDKTYYSHLCKKRKPNAEAFLSILEENKLMANKTLFIDDSIQHVNGASSVGIKSFHLKGTLEILIQKELQFLLA
ncbi:MAG: HAD family hydrolase [Flavobacteriales bacterium]